MGGKAANDDNKKEDEAKKEDNLSSHAKRIKRLNIQTKQNDKEMLSETTWWMRGGAGGKYLP